MLAGAKHPVQLHDVSQKFIRQRPYTRGLKRLRHFGARRLTGVNSGIDQRPDRINDIVRRIRVRTLGNLPHRFTNHSKTQDIVDAGKRLSQETADLLWPRLISKLNIRLVAATTASSATRG